MVYSIQIKCFLHFYPVIRVYPNSSFSYHSYESLILFQAFESLSGLNQQLEILVGCFRFQNKIQKEGNGQKIECGSNIAYKINIRFQILGFC